MRWALSAKSRVERIWMAVAEGRWAGGRGAVLGGGVGGEQAGGEEGSQDGVAHEDPGCGLMMGVTGLSYQNDVRRTGRRRGREDGGPEAAGQGKGRGIRHVRGAGGGV